MICRFCGRGGGGHEADCLDLLDGLERLAALTQWEAGFTAGWTGAARNGTNSHRVMGFSRGQTARSKTQSA